MMTIKSIKARQIFDSRGNPTVEDSLGKSSFNSKVWRSLSPRVGPRSRSSQSVGCQQMQTSPTNSERSRSPQSVGCQQMQTSPEGTIGPIVEKGLRSEPEGPFDICSRPANGGAVKLNKSVYVTNRERRKENERGKNDPTTQYLRSGMVLLKNFIRQCDQVKIVKKCRDLGIGSGGFYRPGFRAGGKLHLQMMCLGKNWNHESRLYEESHSLDGAAPPKIPVELTELVRGALLASNEFVKKNPKNREEIPSMEPDICIVNFYSNSGKLGLHQDRDESKESLEKGVPVVSFSIGDSAEFLYSDARDVDKADKVILESGDVLIFGGKSRHIFHGVSCIKPNTAPVLLTDEAQLRPGRLNLTFRQY